MRLLSLITCLVLAATAMAANKPCIGIDDQSPDVNTIQLTRRALIETAVNSSGEVDFYSSPLKGCWIIKVLAIKFDPPLQGYTLSWVGLDPQGHFLYHGVTIGPEEIFLQAIQSAADSSITRIKNHPVTNTRQGGQ